MHEGNNNDDDDERNVLPSAFSVGPRISARSKVVLAKRAVPKGRALKASADTARERMMAESFMAVTVTG